ncbi:DEAD/DEAH box helicase [Propionimicrobium sp. PCR01-08-3]|uniref:DEAD/DEAH box helicase n=1 Tax=Propionimicrobium sp. PCR01-08-3 TaxID=3052086 RepID=UPI00255C9BBD|nr:DEAD/DEAH box helicase [Propionimicrobium sp. PCR01-08-3]WIY83643.1 DEAD/DEAH box helicase [Propionimicrobium sp. PCR01-08-3]
MIESGAEQAEQLARFSAPTRSWFTSAFEAPTPAQIAAWHAISAGEHALVVAPTGSGKTLAAFLHSLDRLTTTPATDKVRVLYISPLKALAVDVERNLRVPLRGMQQAARRLGLPIPEVRVAVRSGDTPASQRRGLVAHPPDILITTPESLFLMLSSSAGQTLDQVETVIVDEVHALASTKRGAHLALSLERLSSPDHDPQRIGLSATVNPVQQVAGFLAGDRPVSVVEPASEKAWQLSVEVPVDDMTELHANVGAAEGEAEGTVTNSMWTWITPRILDLIEQHHSTICFVNSRRTAERLTAQLNELHAMRQGEPFARFEPPNEATARSGSSPGYDESCQLPIVARAHHGSVSKQRRLEIESDLKSGRLPCVVATSSLELGIDMGAVDLVIQAQSPGSVASALQRVGRAGHGVGAVSHGIFFPTSRGDLLECAVVVDRMKRGLIEPLPRLRNPLDVLAQHLVSICLVSPHTSDALFGLARRADPFRELPRPLFDAVVDMLCGRYPSERFAELRPRLALNASTRELIARPGARQLVTTSGGTIPDRGNYPIYLAGSTDEAGGRANAGRRVGELDEEMVYESRVGDVFTLGTTSWRIEEITVNHIVVSPAPGMPGRLPFWHGDSAARPLGLGVAMGELANRLATDPGDCAELLPHRAGLDGSATTNLVQYVRDELAATGVVPDDHTIVVERFRDELGDWRVCVLSNLGNAILAPLSMLLRNHLRERYGAEPQIMCTNDGIVARVPDSDAAPPGAELLTALELTRVQQIVEQEVGASALFSARFRECAARALLLPRRNPGKRSPLWQQRQRAAQLLQVAREYPDFPITLEAMRECLNDVFDMPGLMSVLDAIAARRTRVVGVETDQASPFAQQLLFGLTGTFIYDGDRPVPERRLAALSLDPTMLDELLGSDSGGELFDPAIADQLEAELQRRAPGWQADDAEQLWDLLRRIGPLTTEEVVARCSPGSAAPEWLDQLEAEGRTAHVRFADRRMWLVSDDLRWLGSREHETIELSATGLERLAGRWARHHIVTHPTDLADRFGLGAQQADLAYAALLRSDEIATVKSGDPGAVPGYVHQQVRETLKRRTLAQLRRGVQPVSQQTFAHFLTSWHELETPASGVEALSAAIDQLAGVPVPASMLESVVLPARVADYRPEILDRLLTDGTVRWSGSGQISEQDGWVQLWPGDVGLPASDEPLSSGAAALLGRLSSGGAWRAADLADDQLTEAEAERLLWELAWAGRIGTDSFAAVRQWCGQKTARRVRTPHPRRRMLVRTIVVPTRPASGTRWAALPRGDLSTPDQLVQDVGLLLGRHGVLTKPAAVTETLVPSFAQAYQVLSALEERGTIRRGYFIDGLGGAQFALPGAVDRLRELRPADDAGKNGVPNADPARMILLASCDPANPYGAALAWPHLEGHRPNRGAGSLVLLSSGDLIAYLERGAHTLMVAKDPDDPLVDEAFHLLAVTVDAGRIDDITIERLNGRSALEVHGFRPALTRAGFAMVPQGFRKRRKGPKV